MSYIALIVGLCAIAFGLAVLLGVAVFCLLRAVIRLYEEEGMRR